MQLREMNFDDYPAFIDLLSRTAGVTVRAADRPEAIRRYLERNPGLSFIAEADGQLIGCALAGHDGRRGYLQHVMVAPAYRRRGVARALVGRCVAALAARGIAKMHIDVLAANAEAMRFWERLGWQQRPDIVRYSHIAVADRNA
jgi:ribosomal protein S18 acetylase RimI-like enzyme